MKNLASLTIFNTILWWLLIVAYFFGPPCMLTLQNIARRYTLYIKEIISALISIQWGSRQGQSGLWPKFLRQFHQLIERALQCIYMYNTSGQRANQTLCIVSVAVITEPSRRLTALLLSMAAVNIVTGLQWQLLTLGGNSDKDVTETVPITAALAWRRVIFDVPADRKCWEKHALP